MLLDPVLARTPGLLAWAKCLCFDPNAPQTSTFTAQTLTDNRLEHTTPSSNPPTLEYAIGQISLLHHYGAITLEVGREVRYMRRDWVQRVDPVLARTPGLLEWTKCLCLE